MIAPFQLARNFTALMDCCCLLRKLSLITMTISLTPQELYPLTLELTKTLFACLQQ